ncbi:MAG: Coenzyme F420 hydrogenase/dehydrogenase, beta subunit C-terminal domain [Chloroflexota bacterium]|jgi:formate dehydrogenase subunit beta
MSVEALLPRSGRSIEETINSLLMALMENGVVDAVLVPMEVPSGQNVTQALIRDKEKLAKAVPVSPVMPVNSATVVSNLTVEEVPGRIGVVLRSCEIRALVELVKLQQASLDKLVVIGIDCPGSYTVADYSEVAGAVEGEAPKAHRFMEQALQGDSLSWDGITLRQACRICERCVPEFGDIRIGLFGMVSGDSLAVELSDDVAAVGLDKLGLVEGKAEARLAAIDKLVKQREEARDKLFDELKAVTGTPSNLLSYFSACLTCHNCSVSCPICYCKQCVFTTSTFEHTPSQYMRRAGRKGALRMPGDTILYQLTRMNHMITSCVGCGQCESGCPSRVPLTAIFRSIGQKVQALYDYVPGRSLEEPPPVTTFKEKELQFVSR